MRTLIIALLFAPVAFAAKQAPAVEVVQKGHYGTQRTAVFQKGKVWVCKTELSPYFENTKAPFDSADLAALQSKDKALVSGCRDKVFISDRTKKASRTIASCATEPETAKFLAQLGKGCGR